MKVTDKLAATLKNWGASFAFGIPGNDVLETVRACEEAGIRFVLAKSEPAAAFMADAVCQITGKPQVLIPALGPGIANATAGIAGALMERSPLAVLTGEMASTNLHIYNHQAFDHVALATPVTKYAATLNAARPAQHLARALDIATSYPAGPVMLNVPADLGRAESKETFDARPVESVRTALAPDAAAAVRLALSRAVRPLALVGRGAVHDGVPAALKNFLESWSIPFFATYKAKGTVDERHPLCLGAVGLSPVVDAENMKILQAADLVVCIGFDPIELRDAWVDAWPQARAAVTLDWGPLNHRIFPLGRECYGDLPAMLAQLSSSGEKGAGAWPAAEIAACRAAVAHIVRPRTPAKGISPAALFKAVSDRIAPDWKLTVDVGAHRILANHAIACRSPGQLLQSNGLCCMGYAVPAAIGAQLACPDAPVVALVGDGCMLMTAGELPLAAELDLPIVVVVLNDQALSLIKLKQAKMQMAPRAVDFKGPRFDRMGEACGATGVRVETLPAFEKAFAEALAARRFTVIDAVVDPAEYMEQM
ncbi:MAG: thiamine pyrophosphate-binding protein [Rhodospirillales bacterium]|nr:thiamine pyrophosphate-binding protein [Rhodospirillales bacterium]